jgi:hypothetical protein
MLRSPHIKKHCLPVILSDLKGNNNIRDVLVGVSLKVVKLTTSINLSKDNRSKLLNF